MENKTVNINWNEISDNDVDNKFINGNELNLHETNVNDDALNRIIDRKGENIERLILLKCTNVDFMKVKWDKLKNLNYLAIGHTYVCYDDIDHILKENKQINIIWCWGCRKVSYNEIQELLKKYKSDKRGQYGLRIWHDEKPSKKKFFDKKI